MELLELGELKKLLELVKVVELGAQNIKWSLHFEGKCFFPCFFLLLLDPRRQIATCHPRFFHCSYIFYLASFETMTMNTTSIVFIVVVFFSII